MKIKFHWGIAIAIFYSVFVLLIVGYVVFSTFHRADLVEEDYYNNELKYQEKIHKMERTKRLHLKIDFVQQGNVLGIRFPEYFKNQNVEGTYNFYKPSNSSYDKKLKIDLNSDGYQTIDTRILQEGFWRVKIDWMAGDSAYFIEKTININ